MRGAQAAQQVRKTTARAWDAEHGYAAVAVGGKRDRAAPAPFAPGARPVKRARMADLLGAPVLAPPLAGAQQAATPEPLHHLGAQGSQDAAPRAVPCTVSSLPALQGVQCVGL